MCKKFPIGYVYSNLIGSNPQFCTAFAGLKFNCNSLFRNRANRLDKKDAIGRINDSRFTNLSTPRLAREIVIRNSKIVNFN